MTKGLVAKIKAADNVLPAGGPAWKFLCKFFYSAEPFSVRERYYGSEDPVEHHTTYRRLQDLIVKQNRDYRKSFWYKSFIEQLRSSGRAEYKTLSFVSEQEVDNFFENYVLQIVSSMERSGYDPSKGADTGGAYISATGTIQKSVAGTHRFCIARILGVKRMPVQILGAHENWFKERVGARGLDGLAAALRIVETTHR